MEDAKNDSNNIHHDKKNFKFRNQESPNNSNIKNSHEKKLKANEFIEDSQCKENEHVSKDSKKSIFEDHEDENHSEKTSNLNRNKKFIEDDLNKYLEKKNILELNILPKVLKKKKADYIYDFVKIRVKLDNHFYILSRFFISRMLTLCKVFF